MGPVNYVLYSETRNVMYIHDKPHARFWCKFIQSKYPKDKWLCMKDNEISFYDIMADEKKRSSMKRIQLNYSEGEGRALLSEINEECEKLAMEALCEHYTFLVVKMLHGEAVTVYLGADPEKALAALLANRTAECIDVWGTSGYVECIYDSYEFTQKYIRKKGA